MMSNAPRRVMSEINVTPLVDIVLVLLIIFMVAAPLLEQGITVDLPAAGTAKRVAQPSAGLTISLTREHLVYLNGQPVTLDELREKLAGVPDQPIVLKSDQSAYVSKLVELWDLCREQGFHQVRILTASD
jgi:biopolymer transport protein TolR